MYKKHWEEFIQGNNAALTFVYEPLFQPLLFVALKYVRNSEVAQDITSELFTSLLETDIIIRQTKWSQIRDISAFLSTIIKCRALDHLKLVKNRQRLNENLTPSSYTDEKRKEELTLYQQFVGQYLNYQSPFKDLLIYHGVGAGKTNSAINVYNILFIN